MEEISPSYLRIPTHNNEAYLQVFGSPAQTDHQFVDEMRY